MFEPLPAEIAFSHFVQSFSNASFDSFFLAITILGNPVLWFLISAILYWKGDEKKSFFLATTVLFIGAVVGVLKEATGRLRPSAQEFRVLVQETDFPFAFPSGHASTISAVFGYYWEKFEKNARIIGLVIVLIVMASRVYLGAHFAGDVIVGALFGMLVGRLVHYAEQKYANIKIRGEKIFEEIGLVAAVVLSLIISLAFRTLYFGAAMLGYFAGVFAFKLAGMDSTKLRGKELFIKEIIGFSMLAVIMMIGEYGTLKFDVAVLTGIENARPEAFFIAGIWVSFIYPILYEKIMRPKTNVEAEPKTAKKKSK